MNNRSQSEPLLNYDEVFKHVSSKFANVFESNQANPTIDDNHDQRHKETRHILTRFLNLYATVREPTRESLFNKMQYIVQKTASYVYSSEPTHDVLKKINENVLNALNNIKSFVDVFSLLVELRRYAEIAQDKKITSEPSLLSLTLHSMACYLISSYQYSFKALTDALYKEEQELHRQLDKDYLENNGRRVGALNIERNRIIGALAMLNNFYGVNHANNMKLLSYYKLPTRDEVNEWAEYNRKNEYNIDLNFGVPIIYQTLLCIYFVYEKHYHASEKNPFKVFISHAIKAGEKADKDANERKVEPMSINRDLVLALDDSFDVKELPGVEPYVYVLTPQSMWYVNRGSSARERVNVTQSTLTKAITDYNLHSRLQEAKQSSSSFHLQSMTQTDIEYFDEKRTSTLLSIVPTVTGVEALKIFSSGNKPTHTAVSAAPQPQPQTQTQTQTQLQSPPVASENSVSNERFEDNHVEEEQTTNNLSM